jgi:hypothetical protein
MQRDEVGSSGVYSAVNGEKVSSFETEVGARDIVRSLNGVYCGTHRYYDGISIWVIRTDDMTHRFRYEADWFCFGKDGEYVVAIHGSALLMKTWDLASGDMLFSGKLSSMLAAGVPMLQFSVSSSAVVLRGSGNGLHYTLEIDPLSGKEIGRGDGVRHVDFLPMKMFVREALSILL